MQSGTTGINTLRIYNPVKQSKDQDPEGVFLRRWLPELAGLPDAHIHEPWKAPERVLKAAGVRIGTDYPAAVVEPVAAAREAREKVYARRRSDEFQEEKRRIVKKHASRRRPRGEDPQPRARRSSAPDRQTSFDF